MVLSAMIFVLPCYTTSHHDACRNLYWRSRRDFLLGIRRGQPARAQIQRWCSGHECMNGRSQRLARADSLYHVMTAPNWDTGAWIGWRSVVRLRVGTM